MSQQNDIEKQQTSLEQTENQTEQITQVQGNEEMGAEKPIRELSPQEKRRKALYDKTRLLTYGEFVKIPVGATWVIETSLADAGHAERKKYQSNEMEWKYVIQALIPHLDETRKHELRFTPRVGDKLQKVLEFGYTRIQVTRNNEEGAKVDYEFKGLE